VTTIPNDSANRQWICENSGSLLAFDQRLGFGEKRPVLALRKEDGAGAEIGFPQLPKESSGGVGVAQD